LATRTEQTCALAALYCALNDDAQAVSALLRSGEWARALAVAQRGGAARDSAQQLEISLAMLRVAVRANDPVRLKVGLVPPIPPRVPLAFASASGDTVARSLLLLLTPSPLSPVPQSVWEMLPEHFAAPASLCAIFRDAAAAELAASDAPERPPLVAAPGAIGLSALVPQLRAQLSLV
jgi:hypothetical protein